MGKFRLFFAEFKGEVMLFAGLLFMLLWGVNSFPFLDPDSYQWLEKSFEIFRRGDWLTHSMWFGKPPLVIWLTTLSMKAFGFNLLGLKFANIAISFLAVLFVYLLAKEMFDRKTALWSAVMFSVCPNFLFLRFSHKMDIAVCLFMTAAFYFFYMFRKDGKIFRIYMFWACCFAGFMSKSVYAFFPVILIPLVALLTRDAGVQRKIKGSMLHHAIAVILLIVIVSPWFVAQYQTHGQKFLQYQYVENLGRLLFKGGDLGNRDNNVIAYTQDTFITFLPWAIFAVPALMYVWKRAKKDFNLSLLLWWFLPPLVAFSLSGDIKAVRYLMFAFPPLMMAMSLFILQMKPGRRMKGWVLSISMLLLALAVALILFGTRSPDAFVRSLVPFLSPFLLIFFGGMALFSVLFWKGARSAFGVLTGTTAASLIVLQALAFGYLPKLYPNIEVSRRLVDRLTMERPVIVTDMKFRDYVYMGEKVRLLEDVGAANLSEGDYVASSLEHDALSKKLGRKLDLIFADDAVYKSGRRITPYRLFRIM